ncbi:MAG: dephospho-CoA kinase [Bacteroidales bacterium]|nr:dephospho-CoA kinase [Bacteroidales bacterium]
MLKIGLTGNIGSGKSLVCQLFEKLGTPVFYADIEAKKILDSDALRGVLISTFGEEIEDITTNRIDRKKLAAIVFNNKSELNKLNALIHPELRNEFKRWSSTHNQFSYVIQEAAILFENGFTDLFDKIIVVSAPQATRLERVMQRDKSNQEDVLARMNNQWSDERKEKAADYIINNSGSELLLPQIVHLHKLFSTNK